MKKRKNEPQKANPGAIAYQQNQSDPGAYRHYYTSVAAGNVSPAQTGVPSAGVGTCVGSLNSPQVQVGK